jgi:hypothetical protein
MKFVWTPDMERAEHYNHAFSHTEFDVERTELYNHAFSHTEFDVERIELYNHAFFRSGEDRTLQPRFLSMWRGQNSTTTLSFEVERTELYNHAFFRSGEDRTLQPRFLSKWRGQNSTTTLSFDVERTELYNHAFFRCGEDRTLQPRFLTHWIRCGEVSQILLGFYRILEKKEFLNVFSWILLNFWGFSTQLFGLLFSVRKWVMDRNASKTALKSLAHKISIKSFKNDRILEWCERGRTTLNYIWKKEIVVFLAI